jgi:hypothetical protein
MNFEYRALHVAQEAKKRVTCDDGKRELRVFE